MKPEKAKLVGVQSPTGTDGFCVPIFSWHGNSNHLLVQIVDGDNTIQAFEPFFDNQKITPIEFELNREIGDPAFWYFVIRDNIICGTIEEVRSEFQSSFYILNDNPYVELQIATACGLEEQEDRAIRRVHALLLEELGSASAGAWLDANVLSPKIRIWLASLFKTMTIKPQLIDILSGVIAITRDRATMVFVPNSIEKKVRKEELSNLSELITGLLAGYNLKFEGFNYVDVPKFGLPSGVPQLKREAVAAFGRSKAVTLRQLTKSYFEDEGGSIRAVCTFSTRYDGKGKRKYWFGFHETWNRWLEGAKDGYIIFGCMDVRLCFVFPLSFIREQLPHLRSTGFGRDKYWHIDIVDIDKKKNLLDIPKLRQAISISKYALEF